MKFDKTFIKAVSKKNSGLLVSVLVLVGIFFFGSHSVQALITLQLAADGGITTDRFIDIPVSTIPPEPAPLPNTTTQTAVSLSVTNVATGGSIGYRQYNAVVTQSLSYAWNRTGTFPQSNTIVNGFVLGLSNPNVTIGYDYGVFDGNNPTQMIPEGSTIPNGKSLILKFKQYTSDNIFWFGTGSSMDSPYGEWATNAAPPSLVNSRVTCVDKDLTQKYTYQYTPTPLNFDVYVPFVVNPPVRSVSNLSGLTCGALSVQSDGSVTANCTATGSGTVSPTFNYTSTYGKFYYRYYDYRDMTSVGWGTAGCYGNNIPLSPSPGSVSSPYVFPIPQEAFAYPLTIAASTNNPPTAPTLTCPASVNIGQNVSVTLRATDPDGDQVQYAVDWLGNASAGQNSGWTPLVASGVSQTLTKTGGYATAGSYTIYGWSRDQNGSLSTPSSCVVTVAAGNLPPTAPIITGPRTGTINTNYTYSFTSTDPEGDQILYGIDWDMNGSTDQGNPNGTPFNSGQPLTATHSWSTLGPQTFQARTYDVIGNVSGWTQYTVTISPPLPDLTAATGPGVVRVAGTPVTLTGTVTNSGSANANSFPNNFQVCDSKCSPFNDNVPAGTTTQLLPGQSGGLSMSYTVPSIVPSIVPLQYRICSNDNGSGGHVITESNYNNNCGAWQAFTTATPLPDLTASLVAGSENLTASIGKPVTLKATVANIGSAGTGRSFITTFWSNTSPGAGGTSTQFTSGAPAGFPANYSEVDGPQLPVTRTFNTPGTYYYRACANRDSKDMESVPQSDNTNDCSAWGTITVTLTASPDLTAGPVSPSTAIAGTPVTLSSTATNNGTAASGAFPVLYQISTSPSGSASDVLQASSYVAPIGAGGTAPSSIPYTFASSGTYYTRACANNNTSWVNIVTESNYSNNCSGWTTLTVTPVAVQVAPTCSLTASPATTLPTTLTWSSTNATSCTGGGFSTGNATNGSVAGINTAGTYTLTCTGAGGSCTSTATAGGGSCSGTPTGTLTANPNRVHSGTGTTIIISNVSNVTTSCVLKDSRGTTLATIPANSCSVTGTSVPTGNLTTQTTYTLTCDNSATATATTIVNILPTFKEF